MKGFEICGSTGDSSILVGESLQNLQNYIGSQRVAIITDKNIRHYYSKNFPPHEVIEAGTSEGTRKSIIIWRLCILTAIGGYSNGKKSKP